jgi:hypothetical protein
MYNTHSPTKTVKMSSIEKSGVLRNSKKACGCGFVLNQAAACDSPTATVSSRNALMKPAMN